MTDQELDRIVAMIRPGARLTIRGHACVVCEIHPADRVVVYRHTDGEQRYKWVITTPGGPDVPADPGSKRDRDALLIARLDAELDIPSLPPRVGLLKTKP